MLRRYKGVCTTLCRAFFPIESSSPSFVARNHGAEASRARLPPLLCGVQEVGSGTMRMPRGESTIRPISIFIETRRDATSGDRPADVYMRMRDHPRAGKKQSGGGKRLYRRQCSKSARKCRPSHSSLAIASRHEAAGRTLGETLTHPVRPAGRTRAPGTGYGRALSKGMTGRGRAESGEV